MFLRQLYDSTLAQASYMIGCQAVGEAIVIDPLRDVAPYVALAASEGLRIVAVTETHIHADFVSGVRELAARTGATVYVSGEGGTEWRYGFASDDPEPPQGERRRRERGPGERVHVVHDGDRITVGNIWLDVWHTPGHTPEHISFLVTDSPRGAGPMGIVTGDFVFVGDVGRPDLLERAAGVSGSMEGSARDLYRSLARFRSLPDHLQVLPGHGAGSACGKALGAIPSSTVGYEKLSNWALGDLSEETFVASVLDGQPEPPRYFARMKRINRDGPPVLGVVAQAQAIAPASITRYAADAALAARTNGRESRTWIVDLRSSAAFSAAHIPGAVSVPFGRSFASWAGTVLPEDAEIVLLCDEGYPAGAVRMLSLTGFDRVIGWMSATDAAAAWRDAGNVLSALHELDIRSLSSSGGALQLDALPVVDVRDDREWKAGHVADAVHVSLGQIAAGTALLPDRPFAVHCQSGARSVIAASLLHRLGRTDVVNLTGGFAAWAAAGLPIAR